eukprot:GHVQ01023154.1.p1 GENE.GHVQ01023154.1~~GHVQ01023154.1.p1  ORF type:complete len:974 (+),score=102.32 GHVQ01023154.1:1015-3936(+)
MDNSIRTAERLHTPLRDVSVNSSENLSFLAIYGRHHSSEWHCVPLVSPLVGQWRDDQLECGKSRQSTSVPPACPGLSSVDSDPPTDGAAFGEKFMLYGAHGVYELLYPRLVASSDTQRDATTTRATDMHASPVFTYVPFQLGGRVSYLALPSDLRREVCGIHGVGEALSTELVAGAAVGSLAYLITPVPAHVDGATEIQSLCCGERHVVCRDGLGRLYTWGDNSSGQLGTGDREPRHRPTMICLQAHRSVLSSYAAQAVGGCSTVSVGDRLKHKDNTEEFISHSDSINSLTSCPPSPLDFVPLHIKEVFAGRMFSFCIAGVGCAVSHSISFFQHKPDLDTRAVRSDPQQHVFGDSCNMNIGNDSSMSLVFGWGCNTSHQLSQVFPAVTMLPEDPKHGEERVIGTEDNWSASESLEFWLRPSLVKLPPAIEPPTETVKETPVSPESDSVGGVFKYPSSAAKRVRRGVFWKTLSCGWEHCFGIDTEDRVWAWGLNLQGQLGLGSICQNISKPQMVELLSAVPVKQISCGIWNTVVLTSLGQVLTAGTSPHHSGRPSTAAETHTVTLESKKRKWWNEDESVTTMQPATTTASTSLLSTGPQKAEEPLNMRSTTFHNTNNVKSVLSCLSYRFPGTCHPPPLILFQSNEDTARGVSYSNESQRCLDGDRGMQPRQNRSGEWHTTRSPQPTATCTRQSTGTRLSLQPDHPMFPLYQPTIVPQRVCDTSNIPGAPAQQGATTADRVVEWETPSGDAGKTINCSQLEDVRTGVDTEPRNAAGDKNSTPASHSSPQSPSDDHDEQAVSSDEGDEESPFQHAEGWREVDGLPEQVSYVSAGSRFCSAVGFDRSRGRERRRLVVWGAYYPFVTDKEQVYAADVVGKELLYSRDKAGSVTEPRQAMTSAKQLDRESSVTLHGTPCSFGEQSKEASEHIENDDLLFDVECRGFRSACERFGVCAPPPTRQKVMKCHGSVSGLIVWQ